MSYNRILVPLDGSDHGSQTIPYARIQSIKFTGKDTAAGRSWEAWVKRREAAGANGARPKPET